MRQIYYTMYAYNRLDEGKSLPIFKCISEKKAPYTSIKHIYAFYICLK